MKLLMARQHNLIVIFLAAIRGNLADVASKDSAQETCVNLIASLIGLLLLTQIKGQL